MMTPLRFATGSDEIIQGLGIPYGGPFPNNSDSYGERFTKSTDFCLDWFTARPLLYHHGLDEDAGVSPVGIVTAYKMTDDGVWVEAQLDKRATYYASIKKLIEKKAVGFSSGAMGHLVQVNKSGDIERWPWVELSVTPCEANPFAVVDYEAAKSHFKSAGLDDSALALKAVWSSAKQDDFSDASFAYVEPGDKDDSGKTTPRSKRHLVYKDAEGKPDADHVRDALSRLDQTDIPSADKAKAKKKLMAAAKELGIDQDERTKSAKGLSLDSYPETQDDNKSADQAATDNLRPQGVIDSRERSFEDIQSDLFQLLNPPTPYGTSCWWAVLQTYPDYCLAARYEYGDDGLYDDPTYWKILYTIGDDGEPILGEATQVEQVYQPVKTNSSLLPLAREVQRATLHAQTLVQRTKDLHERRIKEGRVLSQSNHTLLTQTVSTMDDALKALRDLLEATDPQAAESAKAADAARAADLVRQKKLLDLYVLTTFV